MTLPDAVAVLNPVLADSGYPDTGLAGVGVCLQAHPGPPREGRQGRGPAALHEARLDRHRGRRRRAQGREPAVRQARSQRACATSPNRACGSLIEACGLGRRKISEGDLGFRLGPRINAAGRMGMTDIAVRLFFSEDVGRVARPRPEARRAQLPAPARRRRRSSTRPASRVEERGLDKKYKCLVLGSPDWHRGVIGIVASKLKDRFNRPVVLFPTRTARPTARAGASRRSP